MDIDMETLNAAEAIAEEFAPRGLFGKASLATKIRLRSAIVKAIETRLAEVALRRHEMCREICAIKVVAQAAGPGCL